MQLWAPCMLIWPKMNVLKYRIVSIRTKFMVACDWQKKVENLQSTAATCTFKTTCRQLFGLGLLRNMLYISLTKNKSDGIIIHHVSSQLTRWFIQRLFWRACKDDVSAVDVKKIKSEFRVTQLLGATNRTLNLLHFHLLRQISVVWWKMPIHGPSVATALPRLK